MPVGDRKQQQRPSRRNLFRLWWIRSILIAALAILLLGLRRAGLTELPWLALCSVLLAGALFNLALLFRLGRPRPVSEAEFFANLVLDVVLLTGVLYLTGGSTNPLVSYFLIPLIISAAVLRPVHTWAIAGLALACYTLLFFVYRPLDLFAMSVHGSVMGPHFLGMWVNFAFSAFLIAWFVVRMAGTMHSQQRAIARIREQGLRNEQIIGAASIAAGAAHELRTPLATMSLVSEELVREHPELAAELGVLQSQVERCDAILRELVAVAVENDRKKRVKGGELINAIGEKWSLARPEIRVEVNLDDGAGELEIEADPGLDHALLNFLNNAAEASPEDVRMSVMKDGDFLLIRIDDRGPGIPPEIADSLGRRRVSRKEGGLGLGMLVSSASIERLDGEVTLLQRPGGGTRLEVRLPLAR
ncbi:MAG: ATP-binding protein [Lysobacterales bacterium]|jgi:two-component system sensor histidine kinase RegB